MTLYKRIMSCFLAVLLVASMIFWSSGLFPGDIDTQEVDSDTGVLQPAQDTLDEPDRALGRSLDETMKIIEAGFSRIPVSLKCRSYIRSRNCLPAANRSH